MINRIRNLAKLAFISFGCTLLLMITAVILKVNHIGGITANILIIAGLVAFLISGAFLVAIVFNWLKSENFRLNVRSAAVVSIVVSGICYILATIGAFLRIKASISIVFGIAGLCGLVFGMVLGMVALGRFIFKVKS